MLERRRFANEYAECADEFEQRDTLERAIELLDRIEVRRPQDSGSRDDARWDLLLDLGMLPSAPVVAERALRYSIDAGDYSGVRITFDARLSKQALFAVLTELWPELRSKGWVRPTRSLESRKLALVRHVCIDSNVDATWRDRLAAWNNAHPEWSYSDVRALRSDFDRAEKSLTGRKWGLARFYNPQSETRILKEILRDWPHTGSAEGGETP